jgi:DNA primase
MLEFKKLCEDYHIEVAQPGNKHYTEGWLNIRCPFCGGSSFHLGYNISFDYFNCWKCGHHNKFQTVRELLNLTNHDTQLILKEYSNDSFIELSKFEKTKAEYCKLPLGTKDLLPQHIKYLKSRNFNPEEIQKEWGVMGTIGIGPYANRIIIPIEYYGVLCSYQGRDITGKSELRYKACKSAEEVIDHQSIVYGADKAKPYNQCVLVEGVFDAWRLGPGAVCCFGISYTNKQILCLAKNFKTVYVMFDNEYDAQRQADKLIAELCVRGVDAKKVVWDGIKYNAKDPAEMTQKDAKLLMEELGFRRIQ